MRRDHWFGVLIAGLLASGGLYAWHTWKPTVASADYTAGNFTAGSDFVTYAFDNATNVLMGSFALPNPVADTLVIDGAGNTVAAKNALSSFSGSFQLYDTDNGSDLDSTEPIISSANTTLDSGDTVMTAGTTPFTAFPTVETPGTYYVYFDQGVTSSGYDSGEDVYRQIFDNGACVSADGATNIRTPESTWAFLDLDSNSQIGIEAGGVTYGMSGETFIRDADADGFPSAGDTIIQQQASGITFFAFVDKVCFDGSVVNDSEYDPGEKLWWDSAGDCASFTTGVDVILVGGSVPSGASTLASADNELGYLDDNASGSYTCSRAGTCETPVYSGANATSVGGGSYIASSAAFFDSSTEGTDGLHTTGTGWDETGGAEKLVDVASLMSGSDPLYVYTDCNASSTLGNSEDIFINVVSGATAVMTNSVTARTFDATERAMMSPGTGISGFNATSGAIISSADTTLTVGALNGSGTDKVLSPGVILRSIPAQNKFYDHDSSGSFAATDDVVYDTDGSGYYNADDLLTLKVKAAANASAITDADISSVYLYERAGNTCVGSGTDTLVGSDTSSPFLDQAITITKAPYATSDPVASRTICVYADIPDNSVHGKIWTLAVPAAGATFASNSNSPTTEFTATSQPVQFVAPLAATITASSTRISVNASYTFTYTLTDDAIPDARGLFLVTFPSGYGVASAGITCTDDGVDVNLTAAISGQTVRANNASGSPVASGSVVVCVVTNITNPSTVGTTSYFTVAPYAGSTSRTLYADIDNTITLTAGGSSSSAAPVANTITLSAPNGGETLTAGSSSAVTWSTTGSGISYINLYYSTDSGSSWSAIATNQTNDGSYTWTVPDSASTTAMVKLEGTDLVNVADDDSSDAVFTITGSSTSTTTTTTADEVTDETPVEETPTTSTLTGGLFVKLADKSTVYLIDDNLIRHPFFDAQTYFTYQDNFDAIMTVSNDVLNQSVLGLPAAVNAGRMLVKLDSQPAVYTVNIDDAGQAELRSIPDEATAIAVFGDAWSDHVMSLGDTAFSVYSFATTPETSESLSAWADAGNITDRWHLIYPDASQDADGDGAATWLEASWGTDPYSADMDGDGYNDKLEVDTGHNPFVGGGA